MSIYDFTPAELAEIRRADRAMEQRGIKPPSGRGRKPGELGPKHRPGNPMWEFRVKQNLTQAAAARLFGVCEATIRNWELGRSRIPEWALDTLCENEEEC